MKYYDIMDIKEDGYYLSFDNRHEAAEWLANEMKRFPQRVEKKGLHIVENERLTINEKYEFLKQENESLKEALTKLCNQCESTSNSLGKTGWRLFGSDDFMMVYEDVKELLKCVAKNEQ
jgi:predicted nuclease with TOPRIM domain